jgi:hypothetical protein
MNVALFILDPNILLFLMVWSKQVIYLREVQLYHAARDSSSKFFVYDSFEDVLDCSLNDPFFNFLPAFQQSTLQRISLSRPSLSIRKDAHILTI